MVNRKLTNKSEEGGVETVLVPHSAAVVAKIFLPEAAKGELRGPDPLRLPLLQRPSCGRTPTPQGHDGRQVFRDIYETCDYWREGRESLNVLLLRVSVCVPVCRDGWKQGEEHTYKGR